jgi:hypothetical protein
MSGPVAWAEIWNQIGPLSELVLSGTPVFKEDGESSMCFAIGTMLNCTRLPALQAATSPGEQDIRGVSYLDVGTCRTGGRYQWRSVERYDRYDQEGLGGEAASDRARDGREDM